MFDPSVITLVDLSGHLLVYLQLRPRCARHQVSPQLPSSAGLQLLDVAVPVLYHHPVIPPPSMFRLRLFCVKRRTSESTIVNRCKSSEDKDKHCETTRLDFLLLRTVGGADNGLSWSLEVQYKKEASQKIVSAEKREPNTLKFLFTTRRQTTVGVTTQLHEDI